MNAFLKRLATLVPLVTLVVVGSAGAAFAHTVSGAGASNYRTTFLGFSRPLPGITIRAIENGSRVELDNRTATEVVVIGYETEQYLRIGPQGVFRNELSPSTYLNRTRNATTQPPPDATPGATPRWVRISSGHVARWHDHRVHWTSGTLPPSVRIDPGKYHDISENPIKLSYAGKPVDATFRLAWVPGPSPWPWYAFGAVVALGVVALARSRHWGRALATGAVGIVVVDAVHSLGVALDRQGGFGDRTAFFLKGNAIEIVAWAAAVACAVLLFRRRPAGAYLLPVPTLVIAILGGLADQAVLHRSSAPYDFPLWTDRVLTSLTLGLGIGLIAGGLLGRVDAPADPAAAPAGT